MPVSSPTGTISSLGLGSGIDSNGIVSKLVDLEKRPLTALKARATAKQAQISEAGTIKSNFSVLNDALTKLKSTSALSTRTGTSSNTSAATITVTDSAAASTFTLDVDALAKKQDVSTASLPAGVSLGSGTLTLQLGKYSSATPPVFTPSGSASVALVITATDSLASVAAKLNKLDAGISATVLNDGTGQRLLLQSKNSGAANGFRIQASDGDGNNTDDLGISRLAFDPEAGTFGANTAGSTPQYGADAKARINGLAVTSASNTLKDNIPGVTIELLATTTTNYGLPAEARVPVSLAVKEDVTVSVKSIQAFIDAYNTIAKELVDDTKYDDKNKVSSIFQGDSAVLGFQTVLRGIVKSTSVGSAYPNLSAIGVELQKDGTLKLNTTKFSAAANNGTELEKFFTANNNNAQTDGFALKFSKVISGLLETNGGLANKDKALQKELVQNAADQARINDKADAFESRLRKQYTTLDTKLSSLSALASFVSQQVASFNKQNN